MPKISVVIPLYNKAAYIKRALGSVLSQTFRDFEIIVVNDGSTDGSADIVSECTDLRIRMVSQNNSGVSAARNRGIADARGAYISFLDADDEWDPGFLGAVVGLSVKYPRAGIYGTGYRMVFPKGPAVAVTVEEANGNLESVQIDNYFYRASGGGFINASGVMIPREIFRELGTFRDKEHHAEDTEMWARIACCYPIAYDTRILFSFYQTGIGDKNRFNKLPVYDPNLRILRELLNSKSRLPADRADLRALIKNSYLKSCLWLSSTYGRRETVAFVKANGGDDCLPFMSKLFGSWVLWPVTVLFAWGYRVLRSRIAMTLFGGDYLSYGVLYRVLNPRPQGARN